MKNSGKNNALARNLRTKICPVLFMALISILLFVNCTGIGLANEGTGNKVISTNKDLEEYFDSIYLNNQNMIIHYMSGPKATEESTQILKDSGINTVFSWGYSNEWKMLCDAYGLDYMPYIYERLPTDASPYLAPGTIPSCVTGMQYRDEPTYNEITAIEHLAENHGKYYPNKIFYVNCLGVFPDGELEYMNGHTYEEYVDHYCNTVFTHVTRNRYISTDYYPLEETIKTGWLRTYEVIAERARDYDAIFNFYVANTQHYNYRALTEDELRYMVNVGLAYGATSLSYFTYAYNPSNETGWMNGLVGTDGTTIYPTYYMAQTVNRELLSWDHVLTNFKWQRTQHIDGTLSTEKNPNFTACVYDVSSLKGIESVSANRDTIFSEFKGKNNELGYMITNFEDPALKRKDDITVTFENKNITKAIIFKNGVRSVVDIVDGKYDTQLGYGEMVFVIPYDLDEINGVYDVKPEAIGDPKEEAKGIYTVKFETYCDDKVSTQKINKNQNVVEPENPERAGYDFLGWYHDFVKYDFSSAVDKSFVLDAIWKPREDTSFNVNIYVEDDNGFIEKTEEYLQYFGDRAGVTDETLDVSYNAKQVLKHLGGDYCFDPKIQGSIVEANINGDGSTEFNLYFPKFEQPTILYNAGIGNTLSPTVTPTVITAHTYGDESYSILYSSTSSGDMCLSFNEQVLNMIPEGTKNITFYVYQEQQDGMSFNARLVTSVPWSQTPLGYLENGKWSQVMLSIDQFKECVDSTSRNKNISFMNWGPCNYYISGLYADSVPITPSSNSIINVTFDTDGGTSVSAQQIENGGKVTMPVTPEKWGYRLVGWYYNFKKFDFDYAVENDIELKAIWEPINSPEYQCRYTISVFAEDEDGTFIDKTLVCAKALGELKAHVGYVVNVSDSLGTIIDVLGGCYYLDKDIEYNVTTLEIKKDAANEFILYLRRFEMPETIPYHFTFDADFGKLTNATITGANVYDDQLYSYKITTVHADPRIIFDDSVLDLIPETATTVSFYVYHNAGEAVDFRMVQESPWESTVLVGLQSGVWGKVELTIEQFKACVESNDRTCWLGLSLWKANVDVYISNIIVS